MKIVLDTSAYCLCDAGNEFSLQMVEESSALYLPVIVYGELYYGFRYGSRFQENLKRLDRFLDEFQVELVTVSRQVARLFGDIYAALRNKGAPIPTNDIWIAACCKAVGGTLLTADGHFRQVDQIETRLIHMSG